MTSSQPYGIRGPIRDRKRSWDTSPLRPEALIRFAGDLCEVPPGTTSWPIGPDSKRVDDYPPVGMSKRNALRRMRMRGRRPKSGRAEDTERRSSAMSKMLNVEVQLRLKMPGSLIPTWAEKHAEQALTPGRMTPARCRFDAAAAYSAYHASTIFDLCLEITPAVRCRTSLALRYKRPMGCKEILSRQGQIVHLSRENLCLVSAIRSIAAAEKIRFD